MSDDSEGKITNRSLYTVYIDIFCWKELSRYNAYIKDILIGEYKLYISINHIKVHTKKLTNTEIIWKQVVFGFIKTVKLVLIEVH